MSAYDINNTPGSQDSSEKSSKGILGRAGNYLQGKMLDWTTPGGVTGGGIWQSATIGGLKDQVSSQNIQKGISNAVNSMFTPDNIKDVVKSIASGEDPQQVIARTNPNKNTTGSINRDAFNAEISKNIGRSLSTAIRNSKNLSIPTSIAVGGFNTNTAGNVLGRIGNGLVNSIGEFGKNLGNEVLAPKGWGEDIFGIGEFSKKSSSNILNLATTISQPFSPSSLAVSGAGDTIAGYVEEAVDKAVGSNLNPLGQGLFQLAGGNFGKAFDSFAGNNHNVQVKK